MKNDMLVGTSRETIRSYSYTVTRLRRAYSAEVALATKAGKPPAWVDKYEKGNPPKNAEVSWVCLWGSTGKLEKNHERWYDEYDDK